jgi:hypothetical protein
VALPFFERTLDHVECVLDELFVGSLTVVEISEYFTKGQKRVARRPGNVVGIAAPSIIPEILFFVVLIGSGKLFCVNRVEVQIAGYLKKITVCIDKKRLIPPLVEMAGSVMSLVEIGGIGDTEMAHEFLEIRPRGLYDEMKVSGHEDEGEQLYAIDIEGPREQFEKSLPIIIGKKDALSSIPSAGDMVIGIFILYAERAGHGEILPERGCLVKDKDLTPILPFVRVFFRTVSGKRIALRQQAEPCRARATLP